MEEKTYRVDIVNAIVVEAVNEESAITEAERQLKEGNCHLEFEVEEWK